MGGAGLELDYKGEMKEPPFLTVPTFVLCYKYFLLGLTKERS